MSDDNDKLTGAWKLIPCMMEDIEVPVDNAVDKLIACIQAVAGSHAGCNFPALQLNA